MPRKTLEEKEESRVRILDSAAELIRKNGIENTSVSDIMAAAGMTHGGFYRHYPSKEALVSEAIEKAFRSGLDAFDKEGATPAEKAATYVQNYLSDTHIETPEDGCPIPLLGTEVARGSDEWQSALRKGVTQATDGLSDGIPDLPRGEALVLLSTLVGSMVLARGLGEGELREALLSSVREALQTKA